MRRLTFGRGKAQINTNVLVMLPMYWKTFCDLTNEDAPPQWMSMPVYQVRGTLIDGRRPTDLELEDDEEENDQATQIDIPQAEPIEQELDEVLNDLFDEPLTAEGMPLVEAQIQMDDPSTPSPLPYFSEEPAGYRTPSPPALPARRLLPGMLPNGDDVCERTFAMKRSLVSGWDMLGSKKKHKYEEDLESGFIAEASTDTQELQDQIERACLSYIFTP